MEEHLWDLVDIEPLPNIEFEIGDSVVYAHHGAGKVLRKEEKDVLGESREYLTIKILHNDMTVMVPCCNAGKAGLRESATSTAPSPPVARALSAASTARGVRTPP